MIGKMQVWSGTVTSSVGSSSSKSYVGESQTGVTRTLTEFLIDGRPVIYASGKGASIYPGDKVAVSGTVSGGRLAGLAYRDFTNGSFENAPATMFAILCVGPVLLLLWGLGTPLSVVIVPFALIVLAPFLYLFLKFQAANKMVQTVATPSQVS